MRFRARRGSIPGFFAYWASSRSALLSIRWIAVLLPTSRITPCVASPCSDLLPSVSLSLRGLERRAHVSQGIAEELMSKIFSSGRHSSSHMPIGAKHIWGLRIPRRLQRETASEHIFCRILCQQGCVCGWGSIWQEPISNWLMFQLSASAICSRSEDWISPAWEEE